MDNGGIVETGIRSLLVNDQHIRYYFSTWDYLLVKLGQALNPTVIIWAVLVLVAAQRMLALEREVQVEEKTHSRRPTIMAQEALVDLLEQGLLKEWNYCGNLR